MNAKRKRKPLYKPISEERILQLSNDLAEDIRSGTVEEWRSVARYWQSQHNRVWNELGVVRCEIAATVKGRDIYRMGMDGLTNWLNRQTPDSTA